MVPKFIIFYFDTKNIFKDCKLYLNVSLLCPLKGHTCPSRGTRHACLALKKRVSHTCSRSFGISDTVMVTNLKCLCFIARQAGIYGKVHLCIILCGHGSMVLRTLLLQCKTFCKLRKESPSYCCWIHLE